MSTRMLLAAGATSLAVLGAGATLAAGQGSSSDKALFGSLSGANEIGDDGARGAGDTDGRGSATAIVDGSRLCFGITVTDVEKPVAAHIHKGARSANGDVVVALKAPKTGDPGASSGCVSVTSAVARAILAKPAGYYFNVHTSDFPGGAVRGQVSAR